MTVAYQELESKLVTWGLNDNNLRAIIIIGSRVQYPQPDPFADLDLILFALLPDKFTKSQPWLAYVARPWIGTLNHTSRGDPEWVMIFEQGLKVDLVISKANPEYGMAEMLATSPYQEVLERGYRILLDKTGGGDPEPPSFIRPFEPPNFEFFKGMFDQVLISILRAAKFNKRGDLWRAQHLLGEIRQAILQFIEWHTLLTNSTEVDIWYDGRAIDIWADPQVNEKLPLLFPGHQQKAISHSLTSSLDMLDQLSLEIAQELEYPFPSEGQSNLVTWLHLFI